MPVCNIVNSRGDTVASIDVGTTTGSSFPLELIGQGISPYCEFIDTSLYHLMENFADTVEPSNPVEGMNFYNITQGIPHFYNGSLFIPYLTAANGTGGQFDMLPAATALDFEAVATTAIFTAPGDGTTYHPTLFMLFPRTVGGAITQFPQFNLQISSPEDVLDTAIVSSPASDVHANYSIEGTTRFASGVESISIEVTIPSDDTLTMDAILFGYNKVT